MDFTAPMILASMPLLWLAISFALAHMSGWTTLAAQYGCSVPPSSRAQLCSARVGEVRYKGTLLLRATDEGLHMSVVLPFRFGHAPILIPWSEFRDTKTEKVFGIAFTYTSAGEPEPTNLRLPAWVADCIAHQSANSKSLVNERVPA